MLAVAMVFFAIRDRSWPQEVNPQNHRHHAHGGMKMPYDPYVGSGCCDNGDCRPARHRIIGSKVYVEAEGEVLEFDLSDPKIKPWGFKITDQEIKDGKINPKLDAFRRLLEKTWHWCGYRDQYDKDKKLRTHCVLRPDINM